MRRSVEDKARATSRWSRFKITSVRPDRTPAEMGVDHSLEADGIASSFFRSSSVFKSSDRSLRNAITGRSSRNEAVRIDGIGPQKFLPLRGDVFELGVAPRTAMAKPGRPRARQAEVDLLTLVRHVGGHGRQQGLFKTP